MLAYIGNFRDDLQGLVAHIFGMRGGETDTDARSRLGHGTQQRGESYHFPIRLFKAVRVDILSQQGHFLITLSHQIGNFIQDAFHIPAAFPSAGVGNDAIGTKVIAAAHNGNKTRNMISANARRYHITISFRCGKFHVDGFLARLYGSYQVGQSKISIRTYHQIDMMVRNQVVFDTLCHASQYADNQILFLLLERMKKLQSV